MHLTLLLVHPTILLNGQKCPCFNLNKKAHPPSTPLRFFRFFFLVSTGWCPVLVAHLLLRLCGHFHLHLLASSPALRLVSFSYPLMDFFGDYCCRVDELELRGRRNLWNSIRVHIYESTSSVCVIEFVAFIRMKFFRMML